MEEYLDILRTRRTGNILAIAIILAFGVLSLVRLYPFENSLKDILISKDDWGNYARFALDIKHNGILIPSLHENYFAPAGFLYNYFIALCFFIFGENTVPVFIIQNLLLGFSVALIYWGFCNKMKPLTGLAFLLTLFFFALFDVSKHYSFRLLSENLAIFTISIFFYCFIKGIEKNKLSLQISAAVFMGLSILTRPNIFLFGIVLIVIVTFYFLKQKKAGMLNLILFVFFLILITSFLAIRNHFVCGSWTFLPLKDFSFEEYFFKQHGFALGHYIKKTLFCFGFLSPLEPGYQWHPHWTIMWIGYFIYLFFRVKEKRKYEIWEVTSHLFILCYYFLLLLVDVNLGNYGYRFLIPATFIILPFSFIALDKLKNY